MMMRLDAKSVLYVWEAGQRLHPLDRAVLLACAALPELTWDEAADLPVGARDVAILRLRQLTVGDGLGASTTCLACGETCEIRISIQSLLEHESAREAPPPGLEQARLPSSRDLAAVLQSNPQAADLALAALCQGKQASDEIDEAAISRLSEWIAGNDPLSEISLALACHACSHQWSEVFDPPSFFWREIEARAWCLFDEVDCLARVYGWSEREILGLSEARRLAYLERVE